MEVLIIRVDEHVRIWQLRVCVVVGTKGLLAVEQVFESFPGALFAAVVLPYHSELSAHVTVAVLDLATVHDLAHLVVPHSRIKVFSSKEVRMAISQE